MKKENIENAPGDSDITASAFASVSNQVRLRDEDFFSYYANSVSLSLSMWDVRLVFGEHIGDQDGKAVIEESVRIILSRELAKVVNKILTDQLAAYEKKFGVIKIPDMTQLTEPEKPQHKEGLQE